MDPEQNARDQKCRLNDVHLQLFSFKAIYTNKNVFLCKLCEKFFHFLKPGNESAHRIFYLEQLHQNF